MATIKVKRAYEPASKDDGVRILVDRIWPRGASKDELRIDYWAKDVAPSNELRKWYGHDAQKWEEFRKRYITELRANTDGILALTDQLGPGTATLLHSSKKHEINNAVALRDFLKPMLRRYR
ncbi:MAG TPA: DUF488 family protein [Noviherbaspirillum sp.]|nr:DUF488 family protein [Noviherbaspirillum sp.]